VISCASAGLALPVNTAIDKDPNSLFCDINLAQIAPTAKIGWGGRIIRPCGPHPSGAALRALSFPS
jgi:hypothetical protein